MDHVMGQESISVITCLIQLNGNALSNILHSVILDVVLLLSTDNDSNSHRLRCQGTMGTMGNWAQAPSNYAYSQLCDF